MFVACHQEWWLKTKDGIFVLITVSIDRTAKVFNAQMVFILDLSSISKVFLAR